MFNLSQIYSLSVSLLFICREVSIISTQIKICNIFLRFVSNLCCFVLIFSQHVTIPILYLVIVWYHKVLVFLPFCQIYHFEKFSFSSRNPHSLPSFPSPLPYAFLNTAIDNPPSPYALYDIQHSPSFHFVKQHLISHHPTTP